MPDCDPIDGARFEPDILNNWWKFYVNLSSMLRTIDSDCSPFLGTLSAGDLALADRWMDEIVCRYGEDEAQHETFSYSWWHGWNFSRVTQRIQFKFWTILRNFSLSATGTRSKPQKQSHILRVRHSATHLSQSPSQHSMLCCLYQRCAYWFSYFSFFIIFHNLIIDVQHLLLFAVPIADELHC